MTIAYFDCFAGIAGDMALGALLDCGVPLEALRAGLASLPVDGWDIAATPALRGGIHALDVKITLHGQSDAEELQQALAHAEHHDHGDHGHHGHDGHEHHHGGHDHHHGEHDHHHPDDHTHGENGQHHNHDHGRSLGEIRAIIERSMLTEKVKATSIAIFERIGAAEGHLHHKPAEDVHFHEIGGVDSLIDICGVAWCLDYLGVETVQCSPLPLSSGFVDCAHGRMPVPAPATMELLKGAPLVATNEKGEMVTPTGAGIIAALCTTFGPPPALTVRAVGHGAGKRSFAERPNFLRVVVGDAAATTTTSDGLLWESLSLLETNVDDMNPELFSYVMERVFAAGALDAWLQPIQMKKGRPATLLAALCPPSREAAVLTAILRETTTLGVRTSNVRRASLPRTMESVETTYGPIRIKVAHCPELDIQRVTPEYSDVESAARGNNVAAGTVYQAALAAAQAMNP